MVQEIHPKIKVIQKAVYDTEMAKQSINETVTAIEQRLMPKIPSECETLTKARSSLLERLHSARSKRLNAIIKKQLILKQCEKDLRFLYSVLEKMNSYPDLKNVSNTIFPNLAKRLSDLGNLLDSIGTGQEDDINAETFETEIVSKDDPAKALAELSKPLYEKVICNIPFLVLDPSKKLVAKERLSKLRLVVECEDPDCSN